MSAISAFAPGRVNLIGDHTDHTGGLCLPIALTLGVTVTGRRGGDRVRLRSGHQDGVADLPLDVTDPASATPAWARYVAGVIAEVTPATGFDGTITSDLPAGAGLSSSAALEVAVALALGFEGDDLELARRCQRAEQRASGVPCGILDQLSSVSGVEGHALVLDCTALTVRPVPVPQHLDITVVHSNQERALAQSAYAARRAECHAAEGLIGPLTQATADDLDAIADPVLHRRARHVVTENRRVRSAAEALVAGDARRLGELFTESHASLRDDFECSTPVVDALVERLVATDGVHGARMTGGGWGGCVVAVGEPGAIEEGWRVRPGGGARILG